MPRIDISTFERLLYGIRRRIAATGWRPATGTAPPVLTVPIAPGTEVEARMPTVDEQQRRRIPPGVPILVVREPDGTITNYLAHTTVLMAAPPSRRRLGRRA
jgi:hypothetical protein